MKRIHLSPNDHFTIEGRSQAVGTKPTGLWYGIDNSWQEWAAERLPWIYDHSFELELDLSRMLIISNEQDFRKFHSQYKTILYSVTEVIDWPKVALEYGGIETNPYLPSLTSEYIWYYGWDVASGCVWDMPNIKINKGDKKC